MTAVAYWFMVAGISIISKRIFKSSHEKITVENCEET